MMRKNLKECPECASKNIFRDVEKGETICRDCGLVIEDRMVDFSQEWRSFEDDGGQDSKRRTGAPSSATQFDQGLGTEVGTTADFYKLGSDRERDRFFRLRKWNIRISTAIERNLKVSLAELKRVSSYLRLPKSVEEEAARIYRSAVQKGLVRGRSMESVVAGALYAACRRHEIPRTLDEMGEASGIEKKEIGRTYRFVTRELEISIRPSNPADYIPRFASALKLSPETQSKAVEILDVASLIHGEKRTQREVADVAGVTEVTIRNRYKELIKRLKLAKKVEKSKRK